jgi:hypothetical protein
VCYFLSTFIIRKLYFYFKVGALLSCLPDQTRDRVKNPKFIACIQLKRSYLLLEEMAPLAYAEDFDNVGGLLVGTEAVASRTQQ